MNSLDLWLQAIINGIALGWLYVLMALGLTLILSIMGILQLAHGEIYMLGAFAVYYLARHGSRPVSSHRRGHGPDGGLRGDHGTRVVPAASLAGTWC